MAAKDILEKMRRRQGISTVPDVPKPAPLATATAPASTMPDAVTDATVASADKKAARKAAKEEAKRSGVIVTYHCGHKIGTAHLEGQKCPECRNRHRQERNRLRREAQEQAGAAGVTAERKPRAERDGRLPDGAQFDVRYDASAQKWTGTLSLPSTDDISAPSRAYKGESGGVERLLRELADQWRADAR